MFPPTRSIAIRQSFSTTSLRSHDPSVACLEVFMLVMALINAVLMKEFQGFVEACSVGYELAHD